MSHLEQIIVGASIAWAAAALLVGFYASTKGYPWFPIVLCTLVMGFPVPLLVLAVMPSRIPVRVDPGEAFRRQLFPEEHLMPSAGGVHDAVEAVVVAGRD